MTQPITKKYLNVQRSDDISSSDFEQEQENANISRRSSLSLTTSRAVSTSKNFSEKIIDFRKNDH